MPQFADARAATQDAFRPGSRHGSRADAVCVLDLLIAATAEKLGLSVLHADKDFDLIVNLTGQPAEWLRLDDRSRGR